MRNRRLDVQANKSLKLWSRPGESPEQFAERCRQVAETAADQAAAALRSKYETKAKRQRDRLTAAQVKVNEYGSTADDSLLSTAGSLLGAFLGGRKGSSTIAREAKQRAAAGQKRDAAVDKFTTLQQDAADLDTELAGEIDAIHDAWVAKAAAVTTIPIPLEKADVGVTNLSLVWLPVG